MRVEKLLSSAAKIVFLIIHQLELYKGLMTTVKVLQSKLLLLEPQRANWFAVLRIHYAHC